MGDKNYSELARFKAFLEESKMKTNHCIEEIFKNSDINCQIPAIEFLKLEKLEFIGCTALHFALQDYNTNSSEQLLNRGADFTIRNNKGMTALHQAIKRSYNKSKEFWKLKGQLTDPRASLVLSAHVQRNNLTNPRDDHGMTHFHIACMLNHTSAVQFFLDGGVSPNEAIPKNAMRLPGYMPLHIAARYSCFETTQLLLQYGADKHSQDAKKITPLHLLLERRMEITDHMLMHKRAPYDFFKEELDMNEKIVRLLVDFQDYNATDSVGLSVLQVACTLEDTALVEKFLEQGVDLDQSISEESPVWPGYTALHFSIHGNFESVRLLLSRGANILAKDARGVSPLDLCLQRYNSESIHFVLTKVLSQMNLDDILFSDGTTKLMDVVYAISSTHTLPPFLAEPARNVDAFIPHDSPLWPGYTLMHLAAVFPERTRGIEDLYETCDYVEDDCPRNYYNCDVEEEALYLQRIFISVRMGADVTIRDARGSTPVHLAFPLKSVDTFHLLLSNQRKILNPVDERGLSHLHIACASGHLIFVDRMLPAFSDSINDQTTSSFEYRFVDQDEKIRRFSINAGSTPLHIAVAACNFPMVATLLMNNASVYVQDSIGMTPIHLALKSGMLNTLDIDCWRIKDRLLSVDNLTDRVTDFGLSHLHVASYSGNVVAITKLLDTGANIESTIKYQPSEELSFLAEYDSYTPLHMAIRKGNDLSSEILANRGADLLAKEPSGRILLRKILEHRSPIKDIFVQKVKIDATTQERVFETFGLSLLHVACIASDVDWVAKLLDEGADPNAITNDNCVDWSGCSPLHILAHSSIDYETEYKIIELLLDHGADVTLADSRGVTAVHIFFDKCFIEGWDDIDMLLKRQKDYSVNPTSDKGVSHFHAACMSGNLSIIEEFLKCGIDVDLSIGCFTSWYGGYTPLHVAVYHNQRDVIDLLLKYGADIEARDRLGYTPFLVAVRHSMNFESLFDKLVSAGADVHAKTLLGATALEELTSIPSSWTEIELLKKHGQRVNSFNPLTQAGLIGLSLSNDTEKLAENSFYEDVIDAADINDVDDVGRTPLHNIVSCSGFKTSMEAIGGFLKIGYDINRQDKQGRTALHCAVSFCNESGIISLLEHGADVNVTDCHQQTPFTYFLEHKSEINDVWGTNKQDVCNIFVKHIYKLNYLKLPVNALNSNAYAKMIQRVDLEEQFMLDCQTELEEKEMEEKTINPLSISFFDFLSSETRVIAAYPTMPISQRQALKAFFEANQNIFRQDFPQLSCLLYLQYRKALARIDLVESAKYSLNAQLGYNIPDLCSIVIFRFLANDDLRNLISADEYCQTRKIRRLD